MSQRAYCLAAVWRLQNILAVDESVCDFQTDGQPPPICGETYIAVHPGNWSGEDTDAALMERIGFQVTVTRRMPFAPEDRRAAEIWAKDDTGLEPLLRKIIVGLHMEYVTMQKANDLALDSAFNVFVEPVRFRDGGRPEIKMPDWFHAEALEAEGSFNAGLAQTLTFDQALRIQNLTTIA